MNKQFWTLEEVSFIEQNISSMDIDSISKKLNRTKSSVQHKMSRLNIKHPIRWTKEDEDFVKNNYKKMSSKAIGKILNRNDISIQDKARNLNVASKNFFPKERFCKTCGKRLANKYMKPVYCSNCVPPQTGKNNPMWKGGVKTLYFITQSLLRPWRTKVLIRDNHECQACGDIENLNVHHIRLFKDIRDFVIESNPDLRIENYDNRRELAKLIVAEHTLDVGITLCRTCHLNIHSETRGELLETPNANGEDNQQPSASNVIRLVDAKVQRLTGEDSQPIPPTRAPCTYLNV